MKYSIIGTVADQPATNATENNRDADTAAAALRAVQDLQEQGYTEIEITNEDGASVSIDDLRRAAEPGWGL